MPAFRLICAGCGTAAASAGVEPYPFRCRCAGASADVDHVVTKTMGDDPPAWPSGTEANPFVRYAQLLYSCEVASTLRQELPSGSSGRSEETISFGRIVEDLDDSIFAVTGERFLITPFERNSRASRALDFQEHGGVWIKDETGNVSGSHKGRHLFGIMLYLQVLERAGLIENRRDLAIASCGNAALAAAVVARAAGWTLRTFIPPGASGTIVDRLRNLGAALVTCPRQPSETGDPCYLRFKDALADGALPFCCQGPDNGLTMEGGETLAYEMIDTAGGRGLDAIVIQVGGGALASACVQGFERAVTLRRIGRMPRIYTVQTRGAAPLARAYERIAYRAARTGIGDALRYASVHRSEFMWPWETTPHSIAHGILDDETYDWLAVVRGMLETGGRPVVVGEDALESANQQARTLTGINVDHTGSAGLAGLIELRSRGHVGAGEHAAVIFSGVRREHHTKGRRAYDRGVS